MGLERNGYVQARYYQARCVTYYQQVIWGLPSNVAMRKYQKKVVAVTPPSPPNRLGPDDKVVNR